MRATRHRARLTRTVAVVLALLLCAPPAVAQTPDGAVGKSRPKDVYVFPIVFVVSLIAVGAVIVAAAFTRSDDGARLRAATAKIDQALAKGSGGAAADTAPYHTRSPVEKRPARPLLEARLAEPGPLRTPTR